jgi:hypothetical protein
MKPNVRRLVSKRRDGSIGRESVFSSEIEEPMSVHGARDEIEYKDHKNIAILRVDEDVLESALRFAPNVVDDSVGAVVAIEVGVRDRVEVRPEVKRGLYVTGNALHWDAAGCLELVFRKAPHVVSV